MAMFRKADGDGELDIASPPKIGQARPIRAKNVSVIGPTLVFKGELSADEDLVIEGCIEGSGLTRQRYSPEYEEEAVRHFLDRVYSVCL